MDDFERDTLVFDPIRDDEPDADILPGVEGWESAGDDPLRRHTVRLEARASRTRWYAAAGLLGAMGLAAIVIALYQPPRPASRRSVQPHQRVTTTRPARRSSHRHHRQARPTRGPKRESPRHGVSHRRVTHGQVVTPVAPASRPTPAVVVLPRPAPAAPAPVEEQPHASQHRRGGQFSYFGK